MKFYKCLIVDDEPIARDIIVNYCSHLPLFQIAASCANALDAKKILQEQTVDLIFLDINMPVLDGISFVNTLKNPPQIIFTTAYKEYATDAFNLAACDYLVKPFSLERFIIAIDRAIERLEASSKNSVVNTLNENDSFFIKVAGKIYRINYDSFLYAEAKGNYTRIVTDNNIILPNISFANFEKLLTNSILIRVHRSFIINKRKIDHIESNRLFIKKTEIPIGNNYKEGFLKSLGL
ncbi:response regulator transcription factor [Panacibacter ginsenosidivorans]|uniref:Response regulator transcription factor n=1 Tax=Panacibacter ginsenosidivorans TaxID=1813871 RepID=A0A5B8V6U8_9BACT|nr:response regulator transcription factor [Panacibacter ginsenosidivorans]QEC66376.1 response regulator transcription factor [Panacibacter ginsenosidivorans]